jgi:hypothetical protein
MRKFFVLCVVVCVGIFFIAASVVKVQDVKYSPLKQGLTADQSSSVNTVKRTPDFGKIPLYFIPNKGQVDGEVRFYAKTRGYTLWMTQGGLIFDRVYKKSGKSYRDISRFLFSGANKDPVMEAVDTTGHRVNIFKGDSQSKWKKDIRTSKAVLYKSLYKHIDLKVYGVEKEIEYDWVVKPGGKPEAIRFKYTQTEKTRIDENGNLWVETRSGKMLHKKPVSYQVIKGNRLPVESKFEKKGENAYGIKVERYDRNYELIIDPMVALTCSTYLGGIYGDIGRGIAVDCNGSVYVTGYTESTDFPTKDCGQCSTAGYFDVFVSKFNPCGSTLVYSTYVGGSGNDLGFDIAIDQSGYTYVTGYSQSSNFPGRGNSWRGLDDAIFFRLDADGKNPCSWYVGGTYGDIGHAIALDSSNNAYITGYTTSTDYQNFPVTTGAFQTVKGANSDAFVCKVSCASGIIYCTYLGGNNKDAGYGIDLDGSNNVYVTGYTQSTDFPLKNPCDNTLNGARDAFVTVFNPSLSGLLFSSYLGGSGYDSATSTVVESPTSWYVSGETNSTDFPVKDAFQAKHGGGYDAFITRFNYSNCTTVFATYLGGTADEIGWHLAVDSEGAAYVTGFTKSNDFPTRYAFQDSNAGGSTNCDLYVTKIDARGNLVYSTYIGGSADEFKGGIDVDCDGNAYITGGTKSEDFPVHNPFQRDLDTKEDAIVSRLSFSDCTPVMWVDKTLINFGVNDSNDTTGSQYFMIRNIGGGTLAWSVSENSSWLQCSPVSGTNFGVVTVSLTNLSSLQLGDNIAEITISDSEAVNSPLKVYVTARRYDYGSPGIPSMPFGFFESPTDSTTVNGSVPMCGWALDDIEVESLKIFYEDGVNLEYQGNALFVRGARPDVAQMFPQYPHANRAGWGYLLQSNLFALGTYTFHAVATDKEGNQVTLGTKTVTINNSGLSNPFGDLYTPAPGEAASGNEYDITGWALTPLMHCVDKVEIYVDGSKLDGTATYGLSDPVIAALFPGFCDSSAAGFKYIFDTIGYSNGLHTMDCTVTDSNNDSTSGIGSRYFNIWNLGRLNSAHQSSNLTRFSVADIKDIPLDCSAPVRINKGYGKDNEARFVNPDENGDINVEIKELERLTVQLDISQHLTAKDFHLTPQEPLTEAERFTYKGYLVVGEQLWPLPVGSTMENKTGTFYWHPAAGHFGSYRLVFVSTTPDGKMNKRFINVKIVSKFNR